MTVLAGFDIGGTKCSVSIGYMKDNEIEIMVKKKFNTLGSPGEVINKMIKVLDELIYTYQVSIEGIGVSCGGPLNTTEGIIMSPPNLPGWDNVHIVSLLEKHFNVPVGLQNDANAGALAEWMWGAGKGAKNMIFLTFGTGMGAGFIFNNQLYSGTNDLAGEVGHVRLENDGPEGYGKKGSFEGFCSGGGISKLAKYKATKAIEQGSPPLFCPTINHIDEVTAEKVGESAREGDPLALEIYTIVANRLGQGLSMLIDILNPQKIIIGSIYGRQQELLEPHIRCMLKKETLQCSLEVCEIEPAGLGENIGDYASLSVARNILESKNS